MRYEEYYRRQMNQVRELGATQKAITDANAALVQPLIDVTLNKLMNFKNPIRSNIARKFYSGNSYGLRLGSQGSASAGWKAAGQAFDENTSDKVLVTYPYKTLGTQMNIAQDRIDDGVPWLDVWMEELEVQIDVLKNIEDETMTVGICSATEPAGLLTQISAGTDNQTVLNCDQSGGDEISLIRLDKAIDIIKGTGLNAAADMIIMHQAMRREIQNAMADSQQWMNLVEVDGGFLLMSYNGIPIYLSSNMSITQDFNGTCEGAETGGATSSIYILEKSFYNCFYNREIYMEPIGRVSSQYKVADLRFRGTYTVKNWIKVSKLIGNTLPNDW